MASNEGLVAGRRLVEPPRMFECPNTVDSRAAIRGEAILTFVEDVLDKSMSHVVLNDDDITRATIYIMDCKLISNKCQQLCKSRFGMALALHCTGEQPEDLKKFEFRYMVDRTGPARETGINNKPPSVIIDELTRRVNMGKSLDIGIQVSKTTYKWIRDALCDICNFGLPKNMQIYVCDGFPEQTMITAHKLNNYMKAINLRCALASNALTIGETERQLKFIYSRAPELKTVPRSEELCVRRIMVIVRVDVHQDGED